MEKRSNQSESLEGKLTDADYSRVILKSRGKLNRLHRQVCRTSHSFVDVFTRVRLFTSYLVAQLWRISADFARQQDASINGLQCTWSQGNGMPHEQQKCQSWVQDEKEELISGHTSHMTTRPSANSVEQKHHQTEATFTEREREREGERDIFS